MDIYKCPKSKKIMKFIFLKKREIYWIRLFSLDHAVKFIIRKKRAFFIKKY